MLHDHGTDLLMCKLLGAYYCERLNAKDEWSCDAIIRLCNNNTTLRQVMSSVMAELSITSGADYDYLEGMDIQDYIANHNDISSEIIMESDIGGEG